MISEMEYELIPTPGAFVDHSTTINSEFGVKTSTHVMCCCSACLSFWDFSETNWHGGPKLTPQRQLTEFLEKIYKFNLRFKQEPSLEIARSLFDDCFKD